MGTTVLDTPCREWQGARTTGGYGQYRPGVRQKGVRRKTVYLHRWVWEQVHGPTGLDVLHRCDNPSCFRLDHLFTGTPADNARDMVSKGRASTFHSDKTHCKQGHPYDEANTYRYKNERGCRTCRAAATRRYKERG